MEYFGYLLKKAAKSIAIVAVLILVLWGTLYDLTDDKTIINYLGRGIAVILLNNLLSCLINRKIEVKIKTSWIVLAGIVLVLYHAGFVVASIFVAAAILVLPLFGATLYESIIGVSLLITLAQQIS
ncbi:hypothetical protein IJ556_08000 [bacterium]|nr:hypothetical protein [bacterium]MBR2274152.1 hypothetical protein [Alphaproteobacteria bacterium]